MAAILKDKKSPYLTNSLSDRHELLHDDSHWSFELYSQF